MIRGACQHAVFVVDNRSRWQERSLKLHALLRGECESCGAQRVVGRESEETVQRLGAYAARGLVAGCGRTTPAWSKKARHKGTRK